MTGMWCSEDKSMFHAMAKFLSTSNPGCAVALVNYRLTTPETPDINFPDHILDVYSALTFLAQNKQNAPYDAVNMVLAGHSVGAWMLLAAMMQSDPASTKRALQIPVLDAHVRACFRTLILVDGIYDIAESLKEYPGYADYYTKAILQKGLEASVFMGLGCNAWIWAEQAMRTNVILLHSPEDELLSYAQPCILLQRLAHLGATEQHSVTIPAPVQMHNPQNQIACWYAGKRTGSDAALVAQIYGPQVHGVPGRVQVDLTSLSGTHDGALHTEVFWTVLQRIAAQDSIHEAL
ncbi:hypothetical protein MVES1_003921 [Malassezia vespertilionis]|uniref:uncharacterized protein n=1 Tax=Malassezia vespertilionis TaxID=2020962 RepID=UPI0024B07298|nr:uncharacterized protein MVES1_003921 [Malassezia vespertilionis]WFD08545.1 hypothetical protein MVES1_003921 [Malassezia vespertilionis]